MKYIKTYETFIINQENPGELVTTEEEENITVPIDVEITGHIGTPIKSIRSQKLGKKPSVKQIISKSEMPSIQKRNSANNRIEMNGLPSES